MRQGSLLSLLLAGLLTTTWAAAEETVLPLPAATPAATVTVASNESRISELQQQLEESERQRNELQANAGQESPQLNRLRQDNQRLKLQLKQAQAQQPPRLLTEQQQWYAIGVGSALLAFIVGRLSAGRRNKRHSEWV
ncbi:MAG: translation initiation factor 2 (IF-2, GTPase) [Pseudomonas sp.]